MKRWGFLENRCNTVKKGQKLKTVTLFSRGPTFSYLRAPVTVAGPRRTARSNAKAGNPLWTAYDWLLASPVGANLAKIHSHGSVSGKSARVQVACPLGQVPSVGSLPTQGVNLPLKRGEKLTSKQVAYSTCAVDGGTVS
jgi:hypothetical protein